MALLILASVLLDRIQLSWLIPFTLATLAYALARSYFWGTNTTRERDLHGRTIIVTVSSFRSLYCRLPPIQMVHRAHLAPLV